MFGRASIAVLLFGLSVSGSAADYTQERGHIDQLYSNMWGSIAIHLDTGFVNSSAQCPTATGNWAGVSSANTMLKATLLMAKATGSEVMVTIQGCESNGYWYKIVDVYVK